MMGLMWTSTFIWTACTFSQCSTFFRNRVKCSSESASLSINIRIGKADCGGRMFGPHNLLDRR